VYADIFRPGIQPWRFASELGRGLDTFPLAPGSTSPGLVQVRAPPARGPFGQFTVTSYMAPDFNLFLRQPPADRSAIQLHERGFIFGRPACAPQIAASSRPRLDTPALTPTRVSRRRFAVAGAIHQRRAPAAIFPTQHLAYYVVDPRSRRSARSIHDKPHRHRHSLSTGEPRHGTGARQTPDPRRAYGVSFTSSDTGTVARRRRCARHSRRTERHAVRIGSAPQPCPNGTAIIFSGRGPCRSRSAASS